MEANPIPGLLVLSAVIILMVKVPNLLPAASEFHYYNCIIGDYFMSDLKP